MNNETTIKEGTLNFWLKENSVNFQDDSSLPLFSINPEGGSILVVKDSDKKIKVFFVVLGSGRVDIETDSSCLNNSSRHMITFTWSQSKICLYIDGDLKAEKELLFD